MYITNLPESEATPFQVVCMSEKLLVYDVLLIVCFKLMKMITQNGKLNKVATRMADIGLPCFNV